MTFQRPVAQNTMHIMIDKCESACRRVFILGAGFSKPAGFPLATELTDEVLAQMQEIVGSEDPIFDFADIIRRLHQWIRKSKSLPPVSIEEFYDYATIFAERFKFEHHGETVGRHYGDTAYMKAYEVETWLTYLDEDLLDVLLKHEDDANLTPIQRFVDSLRPGDAVVTFNYDRLVERCLNAKGLKWSFGLDRNADQGRIHVLKMHGSLDWIRYLRYPPKERPGTTRIFSKTDVNRERETSTQSRTGEEEFDLELFHIHDDARLHHLIQKRDLVQDDFRWGLAGLGPRKRISLIPGLGIVWDQARKALYNAQRIIITGFSFSGFDRLAQIEFARVMAGRAEKGISPPQVTVIDPLLDVRSSSNSSQGRSLVERVESVFRPVEQIGIPHEQINWEKFA
jgi:hypothetical protein